MGAILGLGITHHPGLATPGDMTGLVKVALELPALPERLRTPEGWPEPMRREWGDDKGYSASERHRQALVTHLRRARAALDEFKPDVVLIWEGDQYENFNEQIIPPFCVLAYDSIETTPWEGTAGRPNVWGEPEDKKFTIQGHRPAAKFLATGLLEEGFDVCYAYKPLHYPLGHGFLNSVLYLDYDRKGWDYPVVPFHVNYCGSRVVALRGMRGFSVGLVDSLAEEQLDPPPPMPWRCFDLGRATARVLAASPWRIAMVVAVSWSHAYLTPKNQYLYPDIEADREMYEALRAADYEAWRNKPLAVLEKSGQQKLLTWHCLMGAMAELGRKPDETAFIEGWIFNSSKVFTIFKPGTGVRA